MDLSTFVNKSMDTGSFVLDLESTGLSPFEDRIVGFALMVGDDAFWHPTPTPNDLIKTREILQPLLSDNNISMIGHNLTFDVGMLMANGFIVRNKLIDTMVAAHLVNENRDLVPVEGMEKRSRLGLKKLVKEEFGHVMNTLNEVGTIFGPDLGSYAAEDARWTSELWKLYEEKMRSEDPKLLSVFHDIDMKLLPMVIEMELTGVEIDAVHLRKYDKEIEIEQDTIRDKIWDAIGQKFDISSSKQVSNILFNVLNLPTEDVPFSGKSGCFSTDRRVLQEVLAGNPIVDAIVSWRSKATHRKTFAKGLTKHLRDGRFYAHFYITGTKIGRLCVDGNTILNTSEGSVTISELDLSKSGKCTILTHKNRYRRILAKHYKGKEEMYEVESEDGCKISCTKGHKFLTPRGWNSFEDIGIDGVITTVGTVVNDRAKDEMCFQHSKIKRITMLGIRDVWDISVEEDESYIAGGFVNHNSSKRPLNLQNMPRGKGKIRRAFIAPPGHLIICVDLSQIELRLMCHYTGDPEMRSVYLTNGICDCEMFKKTLAEKGEGTCEHTDIHTRTSLRLNIPRSPTAKGANFGLQYGMQDRKLKSYAKLKTIEDAAKVKEDWFNLYRGIRDFHNKLMWELATGKRTFKNLFGRRRRLEEEYARNPLRAFRQACQFLISSSSQDYLKLATIKIMDERNSRAETDPLWAQVKFILQVHDELVLESPEEIAEDVLSLVKHHMEHAVQLKIPVLAAGGIGKTWDDAKA